MAVAEAVSSFADRQRIAFQDKPTWWINVARVAAIIAVIGLIYSPTVASVALVTAYVTFVASGQAISRFKQIFHRPIAYWGLIFLAVVLIGTTYASVPWSDRWIDVYKWRTLLWFLVVLSIFDEEQWKIRLLVAFVSIAALGLIGSFVATAGWASFGRQPESMLRNAVTQGMMFAVATLVCLWVFMERSVPQEIRWAALILGFLYTANIVFITNGRSGYVVLGIGIGVLLLWKASHVQRFAIMLALFLAAALAFSFSPSVHDRITVGLDQWEHEPESSSLTSMGVRRVFYENTLEILKDHWLLGLGSGGFRQAYIDHVSQKYDPSDWRSGSTGDPHNQYLAVLIQYGIGGLAAFLGWIVAIIRDKASLPSYRKLAFAILCGWCVTSLFSSHFRTFAEGHIVTSFLGVLLATASESRRDSQSQ